MTVARTAPDLDAHENVLRKWMKDVVAGPQSAFSGQGQMKPERTEIACSAK